MGVSSLVFCFNTSLTPWQPVVMNGTFRPGAKINLPPRSCLSGILSSTAARTAQELLLLREHFQLRPSLSSIFSFCSANRAIQNITAQCGALCTERSPTAGCSYRRICALPWWTGTKRCVALDAKQSSSIPFSVSPMDAESCEEAQGQ